MSTKAIEEALSRLNMLSPTDGTVGPALHALEAIRKACVTLDANDVGGFVYTIRDRELLGWDGPRVTAWVSAASLIIDIAKESK